MCPTGAINVDTDSVTHKCSSNPCVDSDVDDALCCQASCATHTCTTAGMVLISNATTTLLPATDAERETTCCEAGYCGPDEKVVGHECTECPAGKTSTGSHDRTGTDTECDATECGPNENVVSNECTACAPGKTSTGYHDASGADTECDATTCGANEKVVSNECTLCEPGTTSTGSHNAAGEDTECDDTECGPNEKVVSNVCTACDPGKTSTGFHVASGDDTECDSTYCGVNEKVVSNQCTLCDPGKTSTGSHDASGEDTTCDATMCGINEMVVSNQCTACPEGQTSTGSHNAAGSDTTCDPEVVALSYTIGTYNMNTCPEGSVALSSSSDCEEAATALGYPYPEAAGDWSSSPGGCHYESSEGNVYYNSNAGTATSWGALVCRLSYTVSSFNVNACPDGSSAISTSSECQIAAGDLGYTYESSGDWSTSPSGCHYESSEGKVYYNSNAGSAQSWGAVICRQAALWAQEGEDYTRCSEVGNCFTTTSTQLECQNLAVASGFAYYAFDEGRGCCNIAATCTLDTPVGNPWKVFRNTEALWPQEGGDYTRCQEVGGCTTTTSSQVECQDLAVASGFAYIAYDASRGCCNIAASCTHDTRGGSMSNPWKVFHQR